LVLIGFANEYATCDFKNKEQKMINRKVIVDIPQSKMDSLQDILDILAELLSVPAALVMRFSDPYLEVFLSSKTSDNPYKTGEKEIMAGSGLYCEEVIASRNKLLVPNALKDEQWKNNPDIKLNMISYLGFPILMPNNDPFGTLCILDNKEHAYPPLVENLMGKFRNLIQSDLEIIFANSVLGDKNKQVIDYLRELQALRGLNSICAYCKNIKDANGAWIPIENYLIRHPEADFSHSICPDCMAKHESN